MAVLQSIRKRYSCRAYLDEPIEPQILAEIFEAARLAPSAKNLQDWRFVIVTDKETKRQLAKAANDQTFLQQSAAVIVACSNSDYVMSCGQPVGPIDVSIALEHIALQAAELGLATCWIGSFSADKVRRVLGIPAEIAVIELMPLGYPADDFKPPSRLPIEKITCYEKWAF